MAKRIDFRRLTEADKVLARRCLAWRAASFWKQVRLLDEALADAKPGPQTQPTFLHLREAVLALRNAYVEAAKFATQLASGEAPLSKRSDRRIEVLEHNIEQAFRRIEAMRPACELALMPHAGRA